MHIGSVADLSHHPTLQAAVGYAIAGEYREASDLLDQSDEKHPIVPTIRAIIAAAGLNRSAFLTQWRLPARLGSLSWLRSHAQALATAAWGEPMVAARMLSRHLSLERQKRGDESVASLVLAADIADLHMASGDHRAADSLLQSVRDEFARELLIPQRARLAVLMRRPADAAFLLADARHRSLSVGRRAEHAVLSATAHRLATSAIRISVDDVCRVVEETGDRHALISACADVRASVASRFHFQPCDVPTIYDFAPAVRLNSAERALLQAVTRCKSVPELSARTGLDRAEAQKRLWALHRKLGTVTWSEAVWLGRRLLQNNRAA